MPSSEPKEVVLRGTLQKEVLSWGMQHIAIIADESARCFRTAGGEVFSSFTDAEILIRKKREDHDPQNVRLVCLVELRKPEKSLCIFRADSNPYYANAHDPDGRKEKAVEREIKFLTQLLRKLGVTRFKTVEEVLEPAKESL